MKQLKTVIVVSAVLLVTSTSPKVTAGPYADALSQCLVQYSSEQDKLTLVKWMFSAMALHPAVRAQADVSQTTREANNNAMATLLFDLLAERCLQQTRDAIENEGPLALQASFSTLGQVATMALFSNPEVAAGLAALDEHIDYVDLDARLGLDPSIGQ